MSRKLIGGLSNTWNSLKLLKITNWNKYIVESTKDLLKETTELPDQARIEITINIYHEEIDNAEPEPNKP